MMSSGGGASHPETLPALAVAARIPASEFALYEKEHLEELMKDLKIPVTVRVRLHKQHRDLLSGAQALTVQSKFDAFFSRVGGASSLAGLQNVPISSLPEAVSFIRGPACPAPAMLEVAVASAYAKADALLAAGPDPHSLSRDRPLCGRIGAAVRVPALPDRGASLRRPARRRAPRGFETVQFFAVP